MRTVSYNEIGRECTTCKILKPWSTFNKNKTGFKGYTNECKTCLSIKRNKKALTQLEKNKINRKKLKKENFPKWKARLLRSSWVARANGQPVPLTKDIENFIYSFFSDYHFIMRKRNRSI